MSTLLKIEKLSGGYPKKRVIQNISLELKRGEFLGIIGPNGSGKSTLLKLLSRVLPAERGKVMLEDKDIEAMKPKEFSRKVAFVAQDNLWDIQFSVEEITLMGRIPHLGRLELEGKKDFAVAHNALKLTDTFLLKDRYVNELSAGERQRVIIARALTQEPVLLFLDEPTAHLDIGHQVQILDLLRALNRKNNLTIVIVLHDLNLASEYCHRILLLDKGSIFKDGSPEEVLTYQNIEAVYKTIVVVEDNPINQRPYVILVSQDNPWLQD
jgi:iron complex transport system ATP-binding protein